MFSIVFYLFPVISSEFERSMKKLLRNHLSLGTVFQKKGPQFYRMEGKRESGGILWCSEAWRFEWRKNQASSSQDKKLDSFLLRIIFLTFVENVSFLHG